MDFSYPSQTRHINAALDKITSKLLQIKNEPIPSGPSTLLPFITLGALNLPIPLLYQLTKHRARRHALATWPQTFDCKWKAHYFPDQTAALLASHTNVTVQTALTALRQNLVLSPLTLSKSRYWTFLTAPFTHFSPTHLLGNVLGLRTIAHACARVPGFSARHIASVTVLTSAAIAAQALHRLEGNWVLCGFSGVLCALTSVAALGAEGLDEKDSQGVASVAFFQLVSDVLAVVRSQQVGNGVPPAREAVDYVGHLTGYAVGAVYWAVVLRGRRSVEGGMLEGRGARGGGREVPRGEDWREIVERLKGGEGET